MSARAHIDDLAAFVAASPSSYHAVAEVARAAIQEDAHAVAVSSYQGGHVEYFTYLRELLDAGGGQLGEVEMLVKHRVTRHGSAAMR